MLLVMTKSVPAAVPRVMLAIVTAEPELLVTVTVWLAVVFTS